MVPPSVPKVGTLGRAPPSREENAITYLWAVVFVVVLVWSGMAPADRATWWLEVIPALAGAAVLLGTYRRFRLTPLVYGLILLHCIVLMIGGHYTYAEVPFFDGWFGIECNNYDKVGHFFQGFVPALIAREILIRTRAVNGRGWLVLFVVSVVLSISAFYELIEWWVALVSRQAAEAFLGTQGYAWDTQSDMALALLGAVLALLSLSRWQDRQIARLTARRAPAD